MATKLWWRAGRGLWLRQHQSAAQCSSKLSSVRGGAAAAASCSPALRKRIHFSSLWLFLKAPRRLDRSAMAGALGRSKISVSGSGVSSALSGSAGASAVEPEDVLQFWFGGLDPENGVYDKDIWFLGGPDFDKELEVKFGDCLKLAKTGALDGWMESARGTLALVIVLDQLSRNIHRKSPLAFAQDERARRIARDTIEKGLDKELGPIERTFLYLPFMHSENLEDHDIASSLFKELADQYSQNEKLHEVLLKRSYIEGRHREVLEQFGRYPSRNVDLGRQSTPEEEEYLTRDFPW